MGYKQLNSSYFDTLKIELPSTISQKDIQNNAEIRNINLRYFKSGEIGISIDETTNSYRAHELLAVFAMAAGQLQSIHDRRSASQNYPSSGTTPHFEIPHASGL